MARSARFMTQEEIDGKVAKLPIWVGEYISKLTRERDEARNTMHKFLEEQKETPFSYAEFIGPWPGNKKRPIKYLDTDSVTVVSDGLTVSLNLDADGEIKVYFKTVGKHWSEEVVIQPLASNCIRIRRMVEPSDE